MKRFCLASVATLLLTSILTAQDDSVRSYTANFTANPPVVDGLQTTAAEWRDASSAQGNWTLLQSGGGNNPNDEPDLTNNRFDAVWNESGLYIRHQVDHSGWKEGRGLNQIDFDYETLNLYFDPNTDSEPNVADERARDYYLLAFSQPLGVSGRTADNPQLGIHEQAVVNGQIDFLNQQFPAGFAGVEIQQSTSVTESFGYAEVFIPWEDFSASDPQIWDQEFDDTGLYHPYAPFDGEEWLFNIARIEDNLVRLPAWVSASGANFFAERPHGLLRFSTGSTAHGDLNGDGLCNDLDIDLLAEAIRDERTEEIYDVNLDGQVTLDDHGHMVEVLHNTYFGDSNFDGEFGSGDLVTVFTAGEYQDGIALNSKWAEGDWDGNGDFDSGDFVKAFTSGGYEIGPRPIAAAVPEPSGLLLLSLGLLICVRRR